MTNISENIRRDILAASVPWPKFQKILAWVTLSKLMTDSGYGTASERASLWRAAVAHGPFMSPIIGYDEDGRLACYAVAGASP